MGFSTAFLYNLAGIVRLNTLRRSLISNQNTRQFSNEEKARRLSEIREYHDLIGLTAQAFSENAFKDYTERASSYSILNAQIDTENTLEQKLEDCTEEEASSIKESLKKVFEPSDEYTTAESEYKESIGFFKKLLKKVPQEYSIGDIRFVLEEVQVKARKAIEAQQNLERENLKKTVQVIANKLNLNPKKVERILTEDLLKAQKEQLDKFNQACAESMAQLDKAANLQVEELLLGAQLRATSKQLSSKQQEEMRRQIAQANKINRQNLGLPAEEIMVADYDVNENKVTAINPNHLEFIISLTGKKIVNNGNGSWSVRLNTRIFDPFYYLSNKEPVLTDLLTMTQAIRASGFDSITLTVNFNDPNTQKERARQSYEAALDSGFEPEKITLKDGNGNDIKPDTIFSPGELQQLHDQAKKSKQELDNLKEKFKNNNIESSTDRVKRMKTEMHDLKDKPKDVSLHLPSDGVVPPPSPSL